MEIQKLIIVSIAVIMILWLSGILGPIIGWILTEKVGEKPKIGDPVFGYEFRRNSTIFNINYETNLFQLCDGGEVYKICFLHKSHSGRSWIYDEDKSNEHTIDKKHKLNNAKLNGLVSAKKKAKKKNK